MSQVPSKLVIASRGSRLALRQASIVEALVSAARPDITVEVRQVTTTGDKDSRPFAAIGGKGLFTSEVERAVLEGAADVAVHSAKDLTAELAPGCAIVCVPARAVAHDVVVGGEGATGEERLASLRNGARVGTSSMRRRALLAEARPDLETVELRGNLDTRMRKVEDGEIDAAILAAAGIERLLGAAPVDATLDPGWWIPPPGQGALAVEALAERADVVELFAALDDPAARDEVTAERAFAARLEGGCSVPLGCLARASSSGLLLTGFLGSPEGSGNLRDRASGARHEAAQLGVELADAILAAGGDEILADLREVEAPEPVEP
ncbi:MAG TPA: hydroxymethylbilane synthase [Actinomycetota bacterium]|jgi:hydroxymethylbilane synthase